LLSTHAHREPTLRRAFSPRPNYRARRPPIVERGTWQVSGPGRITVSVSGTDQRNYDKPTVVVFEWRADALVAVEYERSLFGSNGLQPWLTQ
jgi:hypothetical protein